MNAKKCKALRQYARSSTVGLPDRKLIEVGKGARKILDGTNPDGTPKFKVVTTTGTLRNDLNSTRGVYRGSK